MINKIFSLEEADPKEFYGPENKYFKIIKENYPLIKFTARGNEIKVEGDEKSINEFEKKFTSILNFFLKNNNLSEKIILRFILSDDNNETINSLSDISNNIIIYGNSGRVIKAHTTNQIKLVESILKTDLVFAIGPAGSGKTYTAVAMAVKALKEKAVKKIILTRPAVEAGETIGFLPGDFKDKLDPYLRPLYDALNDMIPPTRLKALIEENIIEIAPLGFMRGRTLEKAFVIFDEAQNATSSQLKMFLTRMGINAKFVVTGDITQIDLPKKDQSGLLHIEKVLGNIKGIDFVYLDSKDVIRHKLVQKIVDAYSKN